MPDSPIPTPRRTFLALNAEWRREALRMNLWLVPAIMIVTLTLASTQFGPRMLRIVRAAKESVPDPADLADVRDAYEALREAAG